MPRCRFGAPALVGLLLFVPSRPAASHPMGNFSISHYAAIRIEPEAIEVRYILDMAEIPTFQEMQQTGITPQLSGAPRAAYLSQKAATFKQGLAIKLDGVPLGLKTISCNVIFPSGAGGLPTMKMGFLYRAALKPAPLDHILHLHFEDTNFPDHAGWKEIVASPGPGITFSSSSVPQNDRSAALSNYPTDLLNSPPQQLSAEIGFLQEPVLNAHAPQASARTRPPLSSAARPSTTVPIPQPTLPKPSTIELQANKHETPRNAFTELVEKKEWGFWFFFTAALIAVGLGAFHALEPGHGKTIVAAYLVGSQGTALHACMLGLIVTASHTAGVYLLAVLTLYASRYIVPEQLYPWLTVGSGVIIMGLGVYLLIQRYRGKAHHHTHTHAAHSHGHDHEHAHHHHPHAHHHHHTPEQISYRQLLALGITGGMIPCPAALVVLLSAVALHRIAFGLFLILAFSLGLAAVLIAIGLVMLYARRSMSLLKAESPLVTRWLPLASAAFITFLGCAITFRALAAHY